MQTSHAAVKAVLVLLVIALHPVAAQYGATYLGCFSFSRLLYLKGMENAKVHLAVLGRTHALNNWKVVT